jgi:hypothetical protein
MAEQRLLAAVEVQKTLGLTEAQLICLLFAPFVNQGAGLERFLRSCHPGMLVAMPDLHKAMKGAQAPEQVVQWMIDVSGLPVGLIVKLYRMRPVAVEDGGVAGRLPDEAGISVDDAQSDGGAMIGERSAGH